MEKRTEMVKKRIREEVERIVEVEEVIYVAYDGTKFRSEEECEKYESTAKGVIEKAFYELMVDGEPFCEYWIWENFGYGSEDFEMAVIDIKDFNDLEIANKYYEINNQNAKTNHSIDKKYVGQKVLVNIGYCYDSIKDVDPQPRTQEELIEQFKKDIDKFFNPKKGEDDGEKKI